MLPDYGKFSGLTRGATVPWAMNYNLEGVHSWCFKLQAIANGGQLTGGNRKELKRRMVSKLLLPLDCVWGSCASSRKQTPLYLQREKVLRWQPICLVSPDDKFYFSYNEQIYLPSCVSNSSGCIISFMSCWWCETDPKQYQTTTIFHFTTWYNLASKQIRILEL